MLEVEAARVVQVFGQPEDVEPPDGIGQRTAKNDPPDVRLFEQRQPAGGPLPGRGAGGLSARLNQSALFVADPGMAVERVVDVGPENEPEES